MWEFFNISTSNTHILQLIRTLFIIIIHHYAERNSNTELTQLTFLILSQDVQLWQINLFYSSIFQLNLKRCIQGIIWGKKPVTHTQLSPARASQAEQFKTGRCTEKVQGKQSSKCRHNTILITVTSLWKCLC